MKFNLSTLSDISDGTHTIKVKAKADGYRDSEFSNEVEWTKTASGYTVTFSSDFTIDLTSPVGYGSITGIKYIDVNNTEQVLPVNNSNYASYRNTTFKAKSISDIRGNYEYTTITIDGTLYYNQQWGTSNNLPLTLTSDVTITEMFSRE